MGIDVFLLHRRRDHFRVRIPEHHVAVQNHAIRPKHCYKNLYETNFSCFQTGNTERGLYVGILRRSIDNWSNISTMSTTPDCGYRDSKSLRWIRNEKKSRTQLHQVFQWLGLTWDLTKFNCSISTETQEKLDHSLHQLWPTQTTTKRSWKFKVLLTDYHQRITVQRL